MQSLSSLFDVGHATHVGNVRKRNEDACLVRSDIGLWAVADGMGGHEAGDVASQLVVSALDSIDRSVSSAGLLEQCEALMFKANRDILEISQARHGATIGTTVAILLVRDAHFACVWAGDSRVYRIKAGAIRQVSRDHTEVEDMVAAGLVSREEAAHLPNNVITRAIGVSEDIGLDVVTGSLDAGDIFVICSDGLTKHLGDEEIGQHAGTRGAQAACDGMLALALERGGTDNVTAIVVRLMPDLRRPTEPTNTALTGDSGGAR